MGESIKHRGHSLKFPNNYILLSMAIAFILANSVGPDEMPHFAAFHLGLCCLQKQPFRISSIQEANIDDGSLISKFVNI